MNNRHKTTEPPSEIPAAPLRADRFYNTFISVLFGFAAVTAVQWFVESLSASPIAWFRWPMFAGVMVLVVHFWLICTSTDELEDKVWTIADKGEPSRMFNARSLFSIVMAILFLFPLVVMAKALESETSMFWAAYLFLAAASLFYDVVALTNVAFASTDGGSDKSTTVSYFKTFLLWLGQDACLLIAAIILYLLNSRLKMDNSLLSIPFSLLTIASLVIDVIILQPKLYFR